MKCLNESLTLRSRAKSFYFASLFLPKKIKSEVEQLYIFCRYLDDLGDNPNLSKQESKSKLLTIKKEIKKEKSSNSIVKNFIQLMKRYSINNKIPIDLITGIQSDFKKVQIKNFDELLIYSYRVAGTVGIMFCKIIGLKKNDIIFRGIQLGIAMQLTNISRDINEDLKMGRIYLPITYRSYKKNNIYIIKNNKEIQKLISEDLVVFLKKVNKIYSNSWCGIYFLDFKYALPISIAAELYQNIGIKIIAKNGNIWNERFYLNLWEKIFFSFKAFFKIINKNKININHNVDSEIKRILDSLDVKIL
tara:strand:+ start:683 stop:1594 length:912 start_codon:yes stop_codon:yes gene_type:complete